jgi:cytochrome P450
MSGRVNLLLPEVRANPYPTYAELRRTAPVCQVDPQGWWVLTRHEDVQAAFKNPRVFSSTGMGVATRPAWLGSNPFSDSMIALDPPDHTRLRGIVNRAFGPTGLGRLEPRVRAFAHGIVERLPAGKPVDFVEHFSLPLPASVIGELIGLEPSLHARFKRWADDLTTITGTAPGDTRRQEEIRQTVREAKQYMAEVVASRRREPREDMVTDLLDVRVDGQALTDDELMSFQFLLLVGGLETTIHLLNHSVRILMERPEVLARLRADRSLIPRFIEEVLRFEPPVHGIVRIATQETQVAGVTLPAGARVLLLLGSANHDEARFPRGDDFELEREGDNNLPFGHGIHFCLGAPLARLEATLAINLLLERLPRLRFAVDPAELRWRDGILVHGLRKLPVAF